MSNVTSLSEERRQRDWNRQRWDWAHAVTRDPDMPNSAKLLAYVLVSQVANHKTGHCVLVRAEVAEAMATNERTVQRAVTALEEAEYLARGPGGYRGSNLRILFRLKGQVVGVQTQASAASRASEKQDSSVSLYRVKEDSAVSLLEGERETKSAGKGDNFGTPPTPPYIDNQIYPKTRARASARGDCPLSRFAAIAVGSRQEAEWNLWLSAHGFPDLSAIGRWLDPASKQDWAMPSRLPPTAGDDFGQRPAMRYAAWLAAGQEVGDE